MAYNAWSVTFGEQPSIAKWNYLGTNDAGFYDGTNLPTSSAAKTTVSTNQSTSSATAADLATTGPSVTLSVGATGKVLLIGSYITENDTTTARGRGFYVVSGANTIAATEFMGSRSPTPTQSIYCSGMVLLTGLNQGSTTFKLQYATTAANQSFSDRVLTVIPL